MDEPREGSAGIQETLQKHPQFVIIGALAIGGFILLANRNKSQNAPAPKQEIHQSGPTTYDNAYVSPDYLRNQLEQLRQQMQDDIANGQMPDVYNYYNNIPPPDYQNPPVVPPLPEIHHPPSIPPTYLHPGSIPPVYRGHGG